ncbi:exodeoxyribonuclease VII small subunit [Knoellia sp. CPCC 206450]|uniref:exodeoxyribonuclease VII small subunit n=1 Tax=Knoellia tibetensis TaxID=3404798 RepID=UPI003B43AFD6
MAKDTRQPARDDAASADDVETTVDAPADDAAVDEANADVAEMSYEAARDELVDIVARLENGQVGLEDSMGLWQRGEVLAAHCAQWLDRAEARLTED